MDLKQLKALQVIVDTGSFSEAASQLGLTQSALSHQLRRLEEELDETLLVRARPRVYPSEAGQAVLASARKIQTELAGLQTHFARQRKGPVTGSLHIAATSLSIVYVLGDLCEAFMEKYPGIEVNFTASETAGAAVKRVLVGASDLAFTPMTEANKQLVSVPLGRTDHVFVVRNSHPLAQRPAVSIDELRAFPFVLFQPGSGTRGIMDGLFLPSGGYGRILTESNDAQFIKRIVSISNGVALMPVYAMSDGVAREKLSQLTCEQTVPHVDIGIVHRRGVQMHAIELFKALCLDLRGPSLTHYTRTNVGPMR